jgi:hypothetical protein
MCPVRKAPSEPLRCRPALIRIAACAGLALTVATPAKADEPGRVDASLERHFTTNALDGDHAVSDWYTLLRGSLRHEWGDADGNAALGAEFQVSRHDTVEIEDDRALALTAQAFRRLRPGLELRGTLSYRVSSDGDDLAVGSLTLGTRTPKQVFGAQAQLGIDLGNAASLVLEAVDSFEDVGRSRFQQNLLPPTQLDADRNRLQAGFRLARTFGRLTLGSSGSALLVSVERLGSPPVGVGFRRYALRGELAWTGADGSTLGVAAGAAFLDADDGLYSRARPIWQVAFKKPLPHDFELRGSYCGRFEDVDSDDPLASWLQRVELAAGLRFKADVALAAGLFWQEKQNLLFENEERGRGLFAEATWLVTRSTTAVLRVDVAKTFKTVIDSHENTVDLFVGWQAKI